MTRLLRPFRTPPLRCQEVVELVSAYLEGTLSRREHARVAAHLAACAHCSVYVEQVRMTLRLLGEVPPETLSAEAEQHLLEAFREFRRDDEEDDGA